jgi:hypothetical protein
MFDTATVFAVRNNKPVVPRRNYLRIGASSTAYTFPDNMAYTFPDDFHRPAWTVPRPFMDT